MNWWPYVFSLYYFCATVFSSVEVCCCFLLELSFLLEQSCLAVFLRHSLSLPFFQILSVPFNSSGSFSRHPVYFSSYLFLICVVWPFLSALLGMYTKLFLYLRLLFLLPSTVPNVHHWNPRTGNGNRHPQTHRSWYNKQSSFSLCRCGMLRITKMCINVFYPRRSMTQLWAKAAALG